MIQKEKSLKECLIELVDIQDEVKRLEKKINNLNSKATVMDKVEGSSDCFPFTIRHFTIFGVNKKVQDELTKYQIILKERYEELLQQQIETEEFISKIETSRMRKIIELRYLSQYTWTKIGYLLKSTGDGVRKEHDRYLKEN